MKQIIITFFFVLPVFKVAAQSNRTNLAVKFDTTGLNIRLFAEHLTKNDSSDYSKAKTLLNFTSNSLQWLATDYKQRDIKEILARGGGNCFELAKVYMALIQALHIKYRPVAEINIHAYSDRRQETAVGKVKQSGNRMSVFGRQHNDHRWVEIYDDVSDKWIPVDPTMNVIGVEQWLKARVWFGERVTIDTSITNAMIVPFAVFVTDSTKSNMIESRSAYYLINEFDKLYNNKLSQLPSWRRWETLIKLIQDHAKMAFEGKENLHDYENIIAELADIYKTLKSEYGNSGNSKL